MNHEDKHLWTKRKLIRRLIKVVGILFILYILGFVALYFYYKHKLFGDFSVSRMEAFEKWKTEKIIFPEEALEAEPFSDEIIQASKEFAFEWKKHEKEAQELKDNFKSLIEPDAKPSSPSVELDLFAALALSREKDKKKSPPPKSIPELFPQVQKFDPLIVAFAKVVSQSDYEMDAFIEGIDPENDPGQLLPDFKSIQTVSYLTWLKSLSCIQEKNFQSTLRYASLNFRASRVHPYSSLITRLVGIALLKTGIRNMHPLIQDCDDREILQSALNIQKQSLAEPILIRKDAFPSSDYLGSIRHAKRKGIDVRIQGLTAQEIIVEWARIQSVYKERVLLPHIKDEIKRKDIIESSRSWEKSLQLMEGKTSIIQGFYKGILAPMGASYFFISIPVPEFTEAHNRERYVKSLLDLLSIETASKLYQIDKGKIPDSLKELVPDYLPKEPLDRFQEKTPYPFHEHFYSIGPDKIDQNGSIPYDPTNGAFSSGDVFLPMQ